MLQFYLKLSISRSLIGTFQVSWQINWFMSYKVSFKIGGFFFGFFLFYWYKTTINKKINNLFVITRVQFDEYNVISDFNVIFSSVVLYKFSDLM